MKKVLVILFFLALTFFIKKQVLAANDCSCTWLSGSVSVECGHYDLGECGGKWSNKNGDKCPAEKKVKFTCDSSGGKQEDCVEDASCTGGANPTPTIEPTSALPTEEPTLEPAAPRYATCDLCGLCQDIDSSNPLAAPVLRPTPGNWVNCRNCLYPSLTNSPAESLDTLKVDDNNQPIAPAKGRWYTGLGCINTNLASFQEQGAAGSVIQTLLNIIFGVAGSVAFLYIIYGSFLVLTSQADPEKLNQGKKVLMGAIVGLIFCLGSVFLVNLIGSGILKIPGFTQ